MGFGHEKLDVNPAVIEYSGWAFRLCEGMKSQRSEKCFDSDTDSDADSEGTPLVYSKQRLRCGKFLRKNPPT